MLSIPRQYRPRPGFLTEPHLPRFARIVADVLILLTAITLSQLMRALFAILFEDDGDRWSLLEAVGSPAALRSAVITVMIVTLLFAWRGFYSNGRAYGSKYKLIVVTEAVMLGYLIVGTVAFLFPRLVTFPRSVLLLSAVLSWIALILSRLWAMVWRRVIALEERRSALAAEPRPKRRTVLVIGGGGYIGSALVPMLLAQGCRVRVLDIMMYGTEPLGEALHHPDCELIQADFRQVDALVRAMSGVDEVVHLGGLVGDPACAFDEELTIDINLAATRAIAEVAKGDGIGRLVFASSCSVYGASDEVLDERSPLNPVSLYARTKIASERVLLQLADERFRPIIVRFGTIYGISGRTRFDLVVNLLTAKALTDGEITVFGGEQWRPFLHVEDAARAVALLLEKPLPDGEQPFVFNVGSDSENYTIGQVGELVRRQAPEALLIDRAADADRRNYRVSFAKIERAIGFRTTWTVEAGIRQVASLIREGKISDYRDAAYSNATFLRDRGRTWLAQPRPQWAHELVADPVNPVPARVASGS
jgi:nucleoside-diphosphate-sugar epimerase